MPDLTERILGLLAKQPGLSDREITDVLFSKGTAQQPVNQACHLLMAKSLITRIPRGDGRLGSSLMTGAPAIQPPTNREPTESKFGEDELKRTLKTWLEAQGWRVEVKWGHSHGVDIAASRGQERWEIEVKGCGSISAMRVNYFLAVVGEILQRMKDPSVKYSIALPDLQQFRNLWARFPVLAKTRTEITALFVSESGAISLA
jgi:hypothetical protein